MADTKPLLHTGPVPVIPVTPPPSRHSYTSAFTSQALRAVAVIATQFPHLAPWLVGHGAGSRVPGVRALSGIPVAGVLAALLYALGLPGWVAAIQRPARGQTGLAPVGRDEVFVQEKTYAHAVKNKKGKKKLVKVEEIDEFAVADPSSPTGSLRRGSIYSPFTWLPFGPGRGRLSSISSLLLNTLALLVVLDQCFSPKLLKHDELTYARVASITPHTATINLRLAPDASINPFDNTGIQDPPIPAAPVAAVSNELIYRPKYIDTAAPVLWEHFKIASTSKEQDWFGQVQLEGLQSGIMYQYRIKRGNGQMWPPYEEAPLNFTTSPDPRLSNKGNFKFIHAGQFRSQPSPYNPLSLLSPALIPWLPTSEPHIAPKPSHLLHLWRDYHLRQPAWRMLGDWLHDMRSRVAWAQIAFGLLGEEIELAGQTRWALGGSSGSEDRSRRGFMASRDVKDVYETLPVLAAHVHSPSEGAILEPGAISCPESSFAYANNHFYRLRKPTLERSARDSHDWMADLSELQTWLTAVNATSGFKFITSPVPLNPFFGGNSYETEWRTAVLDLLRYVPNTVVLSESKHGATASLLRRSVIEICSPPLSLASTPRWWPWSTNLVPDRTKATEETTSTWTRYNGQVVEDISHSTVDTLLRHYPLHPTLPSVRPASHTPSVKGRPIHAKSGSEYSSHAVQGRWTSLEVDTNGPEPLLKVTFWRNGAEGGKFDVHGKAMGRVGRLSRALGGEEETGWGWLKRWGLLPSSWF